MAPISLKETATFHSGAKLTRREILKTAGIAFCVGPTLLWGQTASQNPAVLDASHPLIKAPSNPAQWEEWRRNLTRFRDDARKELNYSGDSYSRYAWLPSVFSCAFLQIWDEQFYNRKTGQYEVDAFLDRGIQSFGGYDSVLLWLPYPQMGFDNRNSFDFWRDSPGGVKMLADACRRFHARGVRVILSFYPWEGAPPASWNSPSAFEVGIRPIPVDEKYPWEKVARPRRSHLSVAASLAAALDADAMFLDSTPQLAGSSLREELDAVRPGVALQPEWELPLSGVEHHHTSWAQLFEDSPVPGVLRNKWFERRHMMYLTRRWDADRSGELHTAWMNGAGILIWEDVFGSSKPWSPRDRSTVKAMLPIQRRYARLFTQGNWVPLVKTQAANVYATLWELDGLRLWTLVNRAEVPASGKLLQISGQREAKIYDLFAGTEARATEARNVTTIEGSIPPRGLGAFLTVSSGSRDHADLAEFLKAQKALAGNYDPDPVRRELVPVLLPQPKAQGISATQLPSGMSDIPARTWNRRVTYTNRECGLYTPAAVTGNGGPTLNKPASLERESSVGHYAIDVHPVTNRDFASFLAATGYRPQCTVDFLKNWINGRPPAGAEDDPVVYVDLDDACAYARWREVRLPTEEEWQNAGEAGRLEFGTKRVWNWTDSVHSDGHTRFCILKGGSWFKAGGSFWWADGGPQPPEFAAKYILMWPGLDRCATVGFRCAVDLT